MATVSVLVPPAAGGGYRAVADGAEGAGDTPGRALDALVERTGPPAGATLVVIQSAAGDEFFSDAQRGRLGELMARWRACRDGGAPLPPDERAELDALIAAELQAATDRSAALLRRARP